jgi:hypothetical protein
MNFKRFFIVGLGWGVGTTLTLLLVFGGYSWYASRPKPKLPPKPWNSSAIKAEFDYVDTEGEKNDIVVNYTLENTTEFDYRASQSDNIRMHARLSREKSLSPFSELSRIDYPIVVPAKKRVRFRVYLGYPYPLKEPDDGPPGSGKESRAAVSKYIVEKLNNLDGFVLLDDVNRFEIDFEPGWKKQPQF